MYSLHTCFPDAPPSTHISEIHCGVVGNIQAFHVCAPGSIPGDGVFLDYFIFDIILKILETLLLPYATIFSSLFGYRP